MVTAKELACVVVRELLYDGGGRGRTRSDRRLGGKGPLFDVGSGERQIDA